MEDREYRGARFFASKMSPSGLDFFNDVWKLLAVIPSEILAMRGNNGNEYRICWTSKTQHSYLGCEYKPKNFELIFMKYLDNI